jgi:hypothetical protein
MVMLHEPRLPRLRRTAVVPEPELPAQLPLHGWKGSLSSRGGFDFPVGWSGLRRDSVTLEEELLRQLPVFELKDLDKLRVAGTNLLSDELRKVLPPGYEFETSPDSKPSILAPAPNDYHDAFAFSSEELQKIDRLEILIGEYESVASWLQQVDIDRREFRFRPKCIVIPALQVGDYFYEPSAEGIASAGKTANRSRDGGYTCSLLWHFCVQTVRGLMKEHFPTFSTQLSSYIAPLIETDSLDLRRDYVPRNDHNSVSLQTPFQHHSPDITIEDYLLHFAKCKFARFLTDIPEASVHSRKRLECVYGSQVRAGEYPSKYLEALLSIHDQEPSMLTLHGVGATFLEKCYIESQCLDDLHVKVVETNARSYLMDRAPLYARLEAEFSPETYKRATAAFLRDLDVEPRK